MNKRQTIQIIKISALLGAMVSAAAAQVTPPTYASTSISLSAVPPANCGSQVTLTAVVSVTLPSESGVTSFSGTSGPPQFTGTVTFSDNGVQLGSTGNFVVSPGTTPTTFTATFTATFDASAFVTNVVNGNQLTASYSGGAPYYPNATSAPVVLTVNAAASLSVSPPGGSTYGQSVTLSASGVPAGATITFTDFGSPLSSGRAAAFSTAALLAGGHSLGLYYSLPEGSICQSNPIPYPVVPAPTTTSIQGPGATCDVSGTVTATTGPSAVPLLPGVLPPSGSLSFSTSAGSVNGTPGASNSPYLTATASIPISGSTTVTATYSGDRNYLPSSATTTATTDKLTLSPATATSVYGQSLTFAASLNAGPAQQASYFEGSSPLGSGASLTIASLTGGTHTITASFGTCKSNPANVTVAKAPTTTTISASGANPSVACLTDNSLTASVTPTGNSGTGVQAPSGSLLFSIDGGAGTAFPGNTYSTSPLPPGAHSIVANYPGDGNYLSSTSGPYSQTVNQPTLTVSAPGTVSSDETFTATVTLSAAPNTPISVTILVDGAPLPVTARLTAGNASASVQVSKLSPGSHTLSASAGLCSAYPALSASTTVNSIANTTLTLSVAASAASCQPLNLTATISPSNAIGTVTFYDLTGGARAILGTRDLSGSTVTLSAPPPSAGDHQYEADYRPSDSNYSPSTATAAFTGRQASTTTAMDAQPGNSTYGQQVTLTATIAGCDAAGAPVITGTVTFSEGSKQLGSAAVSGHSAALPISTLPVGAHTITAVYGGDANYLTSTGTASETVAPIPTTTTLTPANPTTTYSQTTTLTATVTPSAATGKVAFSVAGTTQSVALNNGQATFTTSATLGAGSYSVTAKYSPDTEIYSDSPAATVPFTVNQAATTVTLSAPASAVQGSPITLTANVAPAAATGSVMFSDGDTALGTQPLSAGQATLAGVTLTAGSHTLTAAYSSDSNYLKGSGSVGITVVPPVQITSPVLAANGRTKLTAAATKPYSFNFVATGGTPPYQWSVADGSAPGGLTLSPDGILSGTPPTPGSTGFTVVVQDSSSPVLSTTSDLSFDVGYPPLPAITVSSDNNSPTPMDQPGLTLTLAQGYNFPVVAQVTLTFTPSVPVSPGYPSNRLIALLDPAASADGLSLSVPIAANNTTVPIGKLSPGTVAGVITVDVESVTPAGADALPGISTTPAKLTIDKLPPMLSQAGCTIDGSGSFQIQVTGYSTPLDLTAADLSFADTSGKELHTSTPTVPASQWQTNPATYFASSNLGGMFTVNLGGTAGDISAIGQITIALRNSMGLSQPKTITGCGR